MFVGGYIDDEGNYVRIQSDVDRSQFQRPDSAIFKASEHDRQRKDFAREIVQPFDFHGKPNEDFINAYPEEAKAYGFLPSDEQLKKGE